MHSKINWHKRISKSNCILFPSKLVSKSLVFENEKFLFYCSLRCLWNTLVGRQKNKTIIMFFAQLNNNQMETHTHDLRNFHKTLNLILFITHAFIIYSHNRRKSAYCFVFLCISTKENSLYGFPLFPTSILLFSECLSGNEDNELWCMVSQYKKELIFFIFF